MAPIYAFVLNVYVDVSWLRRLCYKLYLIMRGYGVLWRVLTDEETCSIIRFTSSTVGFLFDLFSTITICMPTVITELHVQKQCGIIKLLLYCVHASLFNIIRWVRFYHVGTKWLLQCREEVHLIEGPNCILISRIRSFKPRFMVLLQFHSYILQLPMNSALNKLEPKDSRGSRTVKPTSVY